MARITKHRILILSVAGGILVVAAIGAFLFVRPGQHTTKKTALTTSTASSVKAPSPVAQQTMQRADAQAASGDTAAAVQSLNEAASHATSVTDKTAYYMQSATLLANNGQSDASVAAVRSAINADPTNWQLYSNLGFVYESIGDNPSAVTAFQEALKLIKQNPPDVGSTQNGGQSEIEGQLQKLGAAS